MIFIIGLLLIVGLSGCFEEEPIKNTENESAKFIGTWKNLQPFNYTYFYSGFENGYTEWTFYNNFTIKQLNTRTPISMGIGEHDALTLTHWFTFSAENNNLTINSIDSNHSKIYNYEFDKNNAVLNLKLVDKVTDTIMLLGDELFPRQFELYRTDTMIFVEITGKYLPDYHYEGFNWAFQGFNYILDANGNSYKISGLDNEYYVNTTLKIKGFVVLPVRLPDEYFYTDKWVYFPGFIQIVNYEIVENI